VLATRMYHQLHACSPSGNLLGEKEKTQLESPRWLRESEMASEARYTQDVQCSLVFGEHARSCVCLGGLAVLSENSYLSLSRSGLLKVGDRQKSVFWSGTSTTGSPSS